MNAHRLFAVCRVALITFFALGLLGSAQGKGVVWVSDSFGQRDDRVGQFADRGEGKWDQVMKDGRRAHSYRQTTVTDQYVELSGSGGVVRLYANQALRQHGGGWKDWCNGGFQNGSPLQPAVFSDPTPPPVTPPITTPPPSSGPDVHTRGVVWVSDSFGDPGDRTGQFSRRRGRIWEQALKDGTVLHTYREVERSDEYVELSGSGGVYRLYTDKALIQRKGKWKTRAHGSFQVGNPLPATDGPTPPVVSPPSNVVDVDTQGMFWVPVSFGQAGDRIGLFVGRDNGTWEQVMQNGQRVHSYRQTAVSDEYVELSGSGGNIRLYADRALMRKGSNWNPWTQGGFRNDPGTGATGQ